MESGNEKVGLDECCGDCGCAGSCKVHYPDEKKRNPERYTGQKGDPAGLSMPKFEKGGSLHDKNKNH